ncbi:hypothetical protein [Rhizobium paknamense]|uniref:DUF5681 domain-containing protein n=1 Tax=Rhizobium paknamense TaxID=1206817 RepID=A0ABU0I918_9HYPH|nr:hypothetical protein [Rhizobium paknamense]MDQ0454729.1 hypothetical protein [Rhizobium paknamense]
MEDLDASLRLSLALLPKPMKNQYAGKGVSRRRETSAARMLADRVAEHLMINWRFHSPEGEVTKTEVSAAILEVFLAAPDDIAKTFANKLPPLAEPGLLQIAADIGAVLKVRWRAEYFVPRYLGFK